MTSNGSDRRGLLTAGGVLSIVAGISQIICSGVLIVDVLVSYIHCYGLIDALFMPFLPHVWQHYILWGNGLHPLYLNYVPPIWAVIGGCIGTLGILALVGGISSMRRKSFGLSLAGAVCALPSTILGILAVIFVALGKGEFGAKD